ncbi:MAG: GNAT family N-acetyltransferase [Phycisphaerae bacterium]|nr:GNAT family N-acetyltransferase [Phycisphaerae bacterium]
MQRIETIDAQSLPAALEILLAASPARPASESHISSFLQYLRESPVTWRAWRDGPVAAPRGLFLALLLPGGTAIGMLPPIDAATIEARAQHDVVAHGLNSLRTLDLHYAEVLLDPAAKAEADLVHELGFKRLTTLDYLERSVTYPWCDPPAGSIEWIPYDDGTHARFAAVLESTYANSQDCPELAGMRPIDDVIAAHQSSGRFTPALWEIAVVAGHDAGCLLLAPLLAGPAAELVYMGVASTSRRQGIGGVLMRRALEHCREQQLRRLSTVVDDRNEPAKCLYGSFGMRAFAQRDAYLLKWR